VLKSTGMIKERELRLSESEELKALLQKATFNDVATLTGK
jgi:hypothetical protein